MKRLGNNEAADDLIGRAVAIAVEVHSNLGREDPGQTALGAPGHRAAITYGTAIAADYAKIRKGPRKMVLEELLRRSGVESHSRVLEVGCGTGGPAEHRPGGHGGR